MGWTTLISQKLSHKGHLIQGNQIDQVSNLLLRKRLKFHRLKWIKFRRRNTCHLWMIRALIAVIKIKNNNVREMFFK